MTEWTAGVEIGPYMLLSPLGAGGMGEVWKARDPRLDRTVAIKRLKTQHSARFEQEARAIAALNHPHICQVFDVGPDFLVLEYIEGSPLRGPLPLDQALRIAIQIASALEAAHAKNILHRDLKPGNILMAGNGAKLLDFGLAKMTGDGDATLTMAVSGTPLYMSPEQIENRPLDVRSDIFSFGAVLYELLSGRRAFDSLAAVLRDEPVRLDSPAAEVVKRCMAKQPAERFVNMTEVRAALEKLAARPAERVPSIAVLPFANMSADKDSEYFSDGLAEEIINALAQNPGLKVIARTSAFAFRGKEIDVRKIAEALDVGTVLEGSVRRSGNRIRVMAQLIKAADGSHLWSQRYDREMADLFDLQDEISQAIASALQVKLSGSPAPGEAYKPSLPAYEALLKARYYMGLVLPDLLPRVREAFEQAIALDPQFALAHSEYGRYFIVMATAGAMPADRALNQVREHAKRALELEPSHPEGHAMLGYVAAILDHDWREAERHFRLAIARSPIPHLVRVAYGMYLLVIGRAAEAVQEMDLIVQEDPLNLAARMYRGIMLAAAGRDEECARECRALLELNPNFPPVSGVLSMVHFVRGELDLALPLAEKGYALSPTVPNAIGGLAGLLQRTGKAARAQEIIGKLDPDDYGVPRALATYHWILGNYDAEAEWFEKAIDQPDGLAPLMLRYFYGRPLRGTPHWARLMRKLNLPEA